MGFIYSPLIGVSASDKYSEETPDLAKLKYFKEQEFLIRDRIRKSRENIKIFSAFYLYFSKFLRRHLVF